MVDTSPMELSKEERAVVLAMRQTERAGNAIFNYATKFDKFDVVDTDAEPFTKSLP
jgi:hypothetical protein